MTTSSSSRRIASSFGARTHRAGASGKRAERDPQAVSKWENDINYPDISLLRRPCALPWRVC